MKASKGITSATAKVLRDGWFETSHAEIGRKVAGIYEWRIEGVAAYIGKSKNLKSRFREYKNNVRKLLNGLPYRKGNPDGFRDVHHELFKAHERRAAVKFTILGFYDSESLNDQEQAAIRSLRETHAADGLRVLNADTRTKGRKVAN